MIIQNNNQGILEYQWKITKVINFELETSIGVSGAECAKEKYIRKLFD